MGKFPVYQWKSGNIRMSIGGFLSARESFPGFAGRRGAAALHQVWHAVALISGRYRSPVTKLMDYDVWMPLRCLLDILLLLLDYVNFMAVARFNPLRYPSIRTTSRSMNLPLCTAKATSVIGIDVSSVDAFWGFATSVMQTNPFDWQSRVSILRTETPVLSIEEERSHDRRFNPSNR